MEKKLNKKRKTPERGKAASFFAKLTLSRDSKVMGKVHNLLKSFVTHVPLTYLEGSNNPYAAFYITYYLKSNSI